MNKLTEILFVRMKLVLHDLLLKSLSITKTYCTVGDVVVLLYCNNLRTTISNNNIIIFYIITYTYIYYILHALV